MILLRLLLAAALSAAAAQTSKNAPSAPLAPIAAPSPVAAPIAPRIDAGALGGLSPVPEVSLSPLGERAGVRGEARAAQILPPHPTLSPLQGAREKQHPASSPLQKVQASDAPLETQSFEAGRTFDASAPADGPPIEAGSGSSSSRRSLSLPTRTFRLANGLVVVVQTDRTSPVVAGSMTYKVGSRHERRGFSGFAHLFEHLWFEGSKSLGPHEFSRMIEHSGGSDNAYTTKTDTTFHWVVPKESLERALWGTAEGMHSMRIDAHALALQKEVVIKELRENVKDNPYAEALDAGMGALAFTRWENAHSTIGEIEDIRNATLEDVRAFYLAHYRPNNAVLALSGNVTFEEAKRLVERHFGAIPAEPETREPDLSEPPLTSDVRARVEDPLAAHPLMLVGWRLPERGTKDHAALRLAASILANQEGPLYRAVVKGNRALGFSLQFPRWGDAAYGRGPDLLGIFLFLNSEATAESRLGALGALMRRLARRGPGARALARAKTAIELETLLGQRALAARAQALSSYAALNGPVGGLARDMRRLLSLSPDDVRRAVKRWIVEAGRAVMLVTPGDKKSPDLETRKARIPKSDPRPPGDQPPPLAPFSAPATPQVTRFTLANGMRVHVVRDRSLPLLEARLMIRAGRSAEAAGEDGLSDAVADLLFKGTKERDARRVEETFDDLGYTWEAHAHLNLLQVEAAGLARNAGPFLRQLATILQSADYPDDEVEQWKHLNIETLKERRIDPEVLIDERLRKELYPGHPYAKPFPGAATLASISGARLRAFHRRAIRPNRMALVLVGDVAPEEARRMLETAFATFTPGQAPRPVPPPTSVRPARFVAISRPGSTEVHLNVSQALDLKATDPDYLAFMVMNHILGGGENGRLFENLRNKHGYTYGAYSATIGFGRDMLWEAEAKARPQAARPSLNEFRSEIRRMRETLVSPEALDLAKRTLAGRLSIRLSSAEGAADILAGHALEGIDSEASLGSYQARLAALTPEDIRRVARRYLDPDKMLAIAVGDPAALEPLRKAEKAGNVRGTRARRGPGPKGRTAGRKPSTT